jgi:alpha-tubulin suppressor-like RCC1 family protein
MVCSLSRSEARRWTVLVSVGVMLLGGGAQAQTQVKAIGWGADRFDSSWSGESFVGVESGGYHQMARRADGTFATWGSFNSLADAPALPPGVDYVSVASGSYFAVALRSDGVAVGWPANVGPTQGLPLSNVAEIAAGNGFSVLRFANGVVWVLGGGSNGVGPAPTPPAGTHYVHVGAGAIHALALRSDGVAIGWGNNSGGQASPPAPPPGRSYVKLDGGIYHSVGLLDDGRVLAWGLSNWNVLNVPALPPGVTYVDIDAGPKHTVALRSDGQVVAWGNNVFGQCNVPLLPPGLTYLDASAGGPYSTSDYGHSVALRSDGRVVAWGGNGITQASTPAIAPGVDVLQIAKGVPSESGAPANALLLSDGNVVTWGGATWAQGPVPALAPGTTYVEVAVGDSGALALRSDGSLIEWGSPLGAPAGTDFVEIAAGPLHRMARRSNGTVALWGWSSLSQPAPALPSGVGYAEIAASYFNVARRTDGAVVAWGPNNSYGQLNVPALPPGLAYVEIAVGAFHALARRSDGSVVAWGENTFGQCNVPSLPAGLTYVEVTAADNYSAALRSDGVLRVWGSSNGLQNAPPLAAGQRFVGIEAGRNAMSARVEQPWDVYCTAKVNSLGCSPQIGASGQPRASQSSGFAISGIGVGNQLNGLLFYSLNSSSTAVPFQCGWRCMSGAIQRSPVRGAGGAGAPNSNCTGVFVIDMNAFAAGALGGSPDPLLSQVGAVVRTQWWGRDSGFAAPCNSTLSDALAYTVAP